MSYKVVIEGKKYDNTFTIDENKLDFLMRVLRSNTPFAMKLWSMSDIHTAVVDSGVFAEDEEEPTEEDLEEVLNRINTDVFEDCQDYEWDEIYATYHEVMNDRKRG